MSWEATVPFPAEDMGKCRGCKATIGWVKKQLDDGSVKPHPVEVRGWHGISVPLSRPVGHKGLTLAGEEVRVEEPAGLFNQADTVCFESHFTHCEERARFWKDRR